MPEVVRVSAVESSRDLFAAIEGYFKQGRYAEITQAIGMHSILVDRNRTIEDQRHLYRIVLSLLKSRIGAGLGARYASWYSEFPKLLDLIESSGQVVTDSLSAQVLASHRAAFGPFKSADDFYFWALDDRRLTLNQIVKYFEASVEAFSK